VESVRSTSPEPRQAERRRVTVLFADLVGSTSISGQLDPEDLRGLIRSYLTASSTVVQHFGGRVAQYLGDGILANFGYPMAHEDDAERAVRAGLGIVEAVKQLRPVPIAAANIELSVRVGIATGLVIAGDSPGGRPGEEDGLVGETLNLAARLQASADPNAVVITAETRHLVGDRFVCVDLGTITLKGVSRPIQAWRVMHPDETLSRFEAAHPADLTPLVGRKEEFGLLMRRWNDAMSGRGQVVLLTGEPGIGKSRLIQNLEERVAQESQRVVLLQCSPYQSNSVLYPVGTALERLAEFEREDSMERKLAKLEALLGQCGQNVETMVPLLAPLVSVSTGDRYAPVQVTQQRRRELTLAALQSLIEGLCGERGLLLVFEDVHWIDPTSQEWLNVLVERADRQRMLAVITCRPGYAPGWTGLPHLTLSTLNRLNPSEAAEIAQRVAKGKALPEPILLHIVTKTDGVPLFIEELTKNVLESGLLREHAERYELVGAIPPLAIPATLHDSLMARLDQLASGPKVAQIGSAIGRQFSYELLAAVASMPSAELDAALGQLVDAELVLCQGTPPRATYSFKHALIQDAAYGTLLLVRRQALHARIVEVLETQFPEMLEANPELLAHHCTEAHLGPKALHYWQLAGRRASERSANVEAISHLTRGLDLVATLHETVERRRQELDLLLALGPVLMNTKGPRTREVAETYSRALKLCSTLPDSPQHFAAMWGSWRIFEHFETALEIAQKLLELAGRLNDPGLSLQAHHCLWASLFHLGRHEACCEHVDEGLRLYDAGNYRTHGAVYGGHDPKVCGIGARAFSLWLLGFPDQALAAGREAMTWARHLAHAGSLVHALDMNLLLHRYRRDPKTVQSRAAELMRFSDTQGFSAHKAKGTMFMGWALAELGGIDRGIADMRQGLDELKAVVTGEDFPILKEMLATACVKAGQSSLALDLLGEALAETERSGLCYWNAELHRSRGEALLASSPAQAEEAEAHFRRALSVAREQNARSLELRAAMSLATFERSRGETAAACAWLVPVYEWFREGFDTVDLREARALLHELSPPPARRMATQ
jgi:class 3 adenylate cyclase/predicted ATPase